MEVLRSSAEYSQIVESCEKELGEAHKNREVIEEQFNTVTRHLIELSAQRTDFIKKKHDIQVILNKAKENIRRISAEKSSARDRYFSAVREGR